MSGLQRHAICMCCNDATRFKTAVAKVNNKNRILSNMISRFAVDKKKFSVWINLYRRSLFIIQNDAKHIHFMCGTCFYVNESEMTGAETKLRETLYIVFYIVYYFGDETIYHETLRLLQGDYPITYHSLEKLWHERGRNYE